MRTVLVSDFHLGAQSCALNTPPVLERLLSEVADADQLVLLGDILSLRAAPLGEVLAAARPVFEALGDAMAGRRVVLVVGNHDHRLARPLLENSSGNGAPLPVESTEPVRHDSQDVGGRLASWLGSAELVLAYPGLWVRPGVYATHGHYLDCHMTVPRLESLLAAGMQAVSGRVPAPAATPDDYEAVLAPLYEFAFQRAQWRGSAGSVLARMRAGSWSRLLVREDPGNPIARAAAALAMAGGVAALNRAGFGPFRPDVSPAAISRAGLRAMAVVIERLGIAADHVVFGHTHRWGPLSEEAGFVLPGGTRLTNTGSWTYQPVLVDTSDPDDPYWPGGCVWVDDAGPPRPRALLRDTTMSRSAA